MQSPGHLVLKNLKYFEKLKILLPVVCFRQIKPRFKDLSFLDVFRDEENLSLIENQNTKFLSVN